MHFVDAVMQFLDSRNCAPIALSAVPQVFPKVQRCLHIPTNNRCKHDLRNVLEMVVGKSSEKLLVHQYIDAPLRCRDRELEL